MLELDLQVHYQWRAPSAVGDCAASFFSRIICRMPEEATMICVPALENGRAAAERAARVRL